MGHRNLRGGLQTGSAWSRPDVVAGFSTSPPNATLVRFAKQELQRARSRRGLDIGCGAARNAVPLAAQGWTVLGVDSSREMLDAAATRAREARLTKQLHLAAAVMHDLPIASRSCDLIVAHGVWNLARSGDEFRRAVREAARVAAPGAALFVFTFSRTTLPPHVMPVAGESFVFTQFSGGPQCFLTEDQLVAELRDARFAPDAAVPIHELNLPTRGELPRAGAAPVIFEAAFRFAG